VPGQPKDTAADTNADDTATSTPGTPATPGTAGKKNGKGFWSGVFRGAGQEQTAQTIDDYNSSKDTPGTPGTPAIPGQPGATAKPAAKPTAAGDTTSTAEPGAATATTPAEPAATAAPAVDATQNPLFRDPAAFKAEWDKFIKSQPENYKLITNTELLGVLKDMWKYSGGVRAESKNNKKQGLKK
jgi:hypothetical protein